MRFDRLPDLVIAEIGSFLSYEDNVQFSQTQKRVYNIMSRYGYNKQVKNYLHFDKNGPYDLPEVMPNDNVQTEIGKAVKQYSKIERCTIFHDEYMGPLDLILMDLLTTRTKIGYLSIMHPFNGDSQVYLQNNSFLMNICKKFPTTLLLNNAPLNLYCDEVFVELIFNSVYMSYVPLLFSFSVLCPIAIFNRRMITAYDVTCGLTDKTLEVLKYPKDVKKFEFTHELDIDNVITSFTIKGIRSLVDEVTKADSFKMFMKLGVLKFEEEAAAFEWSREAHSPYTFMRFQERGSPGNMSYMVKWGGVPGEMMNEDTRMVMIMFETQPRSD